MNRYVLVLLALALVFPAMALATTNSSSHDPVIKRYSPPVVVSGTTVATHTLVVNQFRRKRSSQLQASVRRYRTIARHRAAKLGVTIEPRPLRHNIVWLMERRLIWKHKAAHYAARLRAVARQKAAAAKAARAAAAAAASQPSSSSSTTTTTTPSYGGDVVSLGQQLAAARGWTGSEWSALYALWSHESGWDPYAKNPSSGACGIPQFLPCRDWGDPQAQILDGLAYISGRYGTPGAALSHWSSYGWY